ncbi:MAG: DUF4202 family protein [Deltaproteobacteria bacterium]|nr:DUF4202 family protein [Deltaproteobacteria bacterium]MBW1961152.1 DUF4202 family protein [Deltaproteobacteria bacterium]MBW1994767.1 DUF4202 family protein [Deltaproteobacteria bacterium]MBW2150252.1 DUF4202 family protein [Deltaproteobacteria bacterium]
MSVEPKREIDRLKNEILSIISRSKVPEDLAHAHNTLEWLFRLKPDADKVLQICAVGHDIERAIDNRRVRREDYLDYDAFKDAHAKNSALVLREIMQNYPLKKDFMNEVFTIVSRHETGGDVRSDLIRDADALSFFDVNLPLFLRREGWEKTLSRCLWGYKRISETKRPLVLKFVHHDDKINKLIQYVTKEDQ